MAVGCSSVPAMRRRRARTSRSPRCSRSRQPRCHLAEVRRRVGGRGAPLSLIAPAIAAALARSAPSSTPALALLASRSSTHCVAYLAKSRGKGAGAAGRRGPSLVDLDDAGRRPPHGAPHDPPTAPRRRDDATHALTSPNPSRCSADLHRLPVVTTIGLSGLSRPDVALLVAEFDSTRDPELIHAETNGNPLFVRELARSDGTPLTSARRSWFAATRTSMPRTWRCSTSPR